jgi:hypothetical protein
MANLFKSIGNWLGSLFGAPREARLYGDLVRRLRGDREAAERLIELERQRRPNAGRASWIDNALYRLQRDHR